MVTLVLVLTVCAGLVGYFGDRWLVVILAGAAWPAYVLGRHQGLWGSGVGDGWEIVMVVGAAVATLSAAVGLLLRRLAKTQAVAPTGSTPTD